MAPEIPHIDPYLFECQFKAFRKFIEEESGSPFVSFAGDRYIEEHEEYKSDIYHAGRDALAFEV